jgi:hypothetical protein
MAYKNKRKQKTHVRKIHGGMGSIKRIRPIPIKENEHFIISSVKTKTSWLDKIVSSWM